MKKACPLCVSVLAKEVCPFCVCVSDLVKKEWPICVAVSAKEAWLLSFSPGELGVAFVCKSQ